MAGPSASSPAASNSHAAPRTTWPRSGAAARISKRAASPNSLRLSAGSAGSWPVRIDSAGIEARLQLLVAPLARIPAVGRQQRGMVALLRHVAFPQHDDVVGVHHRAEA